MVARRCEISLLVLKKIFHSFAAFTREIFLNTRREIDDDEDVWNKRDKV